MLKQLTTRSLLLLSILAMFSSLVSPSAVYAASNTDIKEVEQINAEELSTLAEFNQEEIIALLEIVDEIPAELLVEGKEQELVNYFEENGISYGVIEVPGSNGQISTYGAWEVAKCAAALAVMVGGAFLGVGVLVKLKNFIKVAGGVKAAAAALVAIAQQGVTTETITQFGSVLVSMGSTILGISEVQEQCT